MLEEKIIQKSKDMLILIADLPKKQALRISKSVYGVIFFVIRILTFVGLFYVFNNRAVRLLETYGFERTILMFIVLITLILFRILFKKNG